MRLILLDEPAVVVGGRSYDLSPQKPVLLLIYLACRRGWVGRDELVTLFWPDEDEPVARHNLRTLLMRSRKLPWAAELKAEPNRISWRVDSDVHAFRDAIGRSDWARALELHLQPLLSGWSAKGAAGFEAWLELERESLLSVWRNASLMRAAELRAAGRHADGASLLAGYLAHDRLAEDVLAGYLEAAYRAGQRAEALVAYDRFADYLGRELGLAPLSETSRLAEAIRDGAALVTTTLQGSSRSLPQALEGPVRLVGRAAELRALSASTARLGVVSGEPGVGKSRLVAEAAPGAHWLRAQEGLNGVPFHPILGLVKERLDSLPDLGPYREDLARLVPEVAPDITPSMLEPQMAKARLLEAVTRFLEGLGTALAFDDLQWADISTLEVLSLLCSRGRVRCLGTYRSGEASAALRDLLRAERARGRLTELRLEPLGAQAIRDLLCSADRPRGKAACFLRLAAHPLGRKPSLRARDAQGAVRVGRAGAGRGQLAQPARRPDPGLCRAGDPRCCQRGHPQALRGPVERGQATASGGERAGRRDHVGAARAVGGPFRLGTCHGFGGG